MIIKNILTNDVVYEIKFFKISIINGLLLITTSVRRIIFDFDSLRNNVTFPLTEKFALDFLFGYGFPVGVALQQYTQVCSLKHELVGGLPPLLQVGLKAFFHGFPLGLVLDFGFGRESKT